MAKCERELVSMPGIMASMTVRTVFFIRVIKEWELTNAWDHGMGRIHGNELANARNHGAVRQCLGTQIL